jgi:hypothetical protein
MAAFAGTVSVYEADTGASIVANSPYAYKEIIATCDDTADDTDTITITLADYGITTLWMVKGYTHTTEGSVIVQEAPTTSVTAGVLTITIGGSTDNRFRAFLIGGV